MNTIDLQALTQVIKQHIAERPSERTFRIYSPENKVLWVKTPSPARLSLLYNITNRLMLRLGMPYFQAPPHAGAPGGKDSLRVEKNMLSELKAAGTPVPEVVASTDEWLVLNEVGHDDLDSVLNKLTANQRLPLWQQAVHMIVQVHQKNCCLSQCFARNIVIKKNHKQDNTLSSSAYQLFFLDFEEDPKQVMTLAQAQARDWGFFMHSTAALLSNDHGRAQTLLLEAFKNESQDTKESIQRIFKQMRFLRKLRPIRFLGRDGIRLYQLGVFAAGIYEKFYNTGN